MVENKRKDLNRDYHMSDCATNNAPALPVGECDCGLCKTPSEKLTEAKNDLMNSVYDLFRIPQILEWINKKISP